MKQYRLMLTFLQLLSALLAIPASPGHVRSSLHHQRVVLHEMQAHMTEEQ